MSKKKKQEESNDDHIKVVAVNKSARRDYEIMDTVEAGLVLLGSEVKSIRGGGVNLKESYVRPKGAELILVGCHVSPYAHSRVDAHEVLRDKKLLLHKKEIERLSAQVQQKGLTLIPLRMYFRSGRCKLELGLGRGRKLHDKRDATKKKEAERDMAQAISRRR